MQVREEAMRSLESSHVIYTSDVLKCTVVKVEGLPSSARRNACAAEVTYCGVARCTGRQKPSKEQGNAECVVACCNDVVSSMYRRPLAILADGRIRWVLQGYWLGV